MRKAISYVSTANINLNEKEISNLFEQVNDFNNNNDITGVLLYSETNFFQLMEGEEQEINSLYSRIEKDTRHNNIIKFIDNSAVKHEITGYMSDFVTATTRLDHSNLEKYLRYIEVLDESSRIAIERVLHSIAGEAGE